MAKKSTKDSLSKKTEADIAAMASKNFNLVLDPNSMTKDEIMDIFLDVQDNGPGNYTQYLATGEAGQDDDDLPTVTSDGVEEESHNVGQPHAVASAKPSEPTKPNDIRRTKRKKVIIFKDKEPGGDRDVPLSINGFAILIKRGQEVAIPEPFIDLLNNTTQTVYERNDDTGEQEAREVPRFNFQVRGDA